MLDNVRGDRVLRMPIRKRKKLASSFPLSAADDPSSCVAACETAFTRSARPKRYAEVFIMPLKEVRWLSNFSVFVAVQAFPMELEKN
uniref:Uncharacterized protein n=1 Tax=Steinernema glaseri TaxID=37863 RepID=A0A1I7ZW72_9BILA